MTAEGRALARGRPRRSALSAALARPAAPVLVLAAGMLVLGIGAALVAAHVTAIALDESLIQQSAVHYASNLPHSLLHDLNARATDRLYSLVLSIAYRVSGGPDAIRADHIISALLFVSTAVPIYLLARRLLVDSWASVAVALLGVAVPWLSLSTALFTENLGYPLFWWALLAIGSALAEPSWRRDLLALLCMALLVATRVQFAAVFVGYVLCVAAAELWRAEAPGGLRPRVVSALRAAAMGFPATVLALAVVVVGVLYARLSGDWGGHVHRLLGGYENVVIRNGLPPNMLQGALVEVIALALGVGLLPALLAFPWYVRTLARPARDPRWIQLAAIGLVCVVFVAVSVYSQGGYLGPITEERYFFYVAPVFWIGAFAAIAEGKLSARDVLMCSVAMAALYGAIPFLSPLTEETAFLAPVESVVTHVLTQRLGQVGLKGLTVQDALAVLALIAGGLTACFWTRAVRTRARWILGAAAAVQLLTAGYAYAVIDGKVPGIQGRTGGDAAAFGWVDAAAGGASVTWFDDMTQAEPAADHVAAAGLAANQTHVTVFWNSQIRSWAMVPQIAVVPVESPIAALPGSPELNVDAQTGAIGPVASAAGLREAVVQTGSPFLQLAGTTLAESPDGFLSLVKVAPPARAEWMATGLQADAFIAGGPPVRISAFAPASDSTQVVTARLTLVAPSVVPGGGAERVGVRATLGGVRREVGLGLGQRTEIALRACLPPGATLATGTLAATETASVEGRALATMLSRVSVAVDRRPCRP